MNEYIKYNQHSYLQKDRKKYTFFWFTPILILIVLFAYTFKKEAYNVYETTAETLCDEECTIHFYYPYSEGFTYDFIKINDRSYEIENIIFGNVVLDSSNIGLQGITLKVKEYKGKNNEFVKLQIYKNKEKMIKKIAKIIKER